MNKVDLVILLIVLVCMLVGYYRGLIKSILSVVQYFLVIILAIHLSPIFSKILIEKFNLDLIIIDWINNNEKLFSETINIISEEILQEIVGRIVNVFAMVALFILLKLIISLVIAVLNKVANLPIISVANKLGGLILGTFNGVLVVYLLILLVNWLPLESLSSIKAEIDSSFLGLTINSCVPKVANEVISIVKTSV